MQRRKSYINQIREELNAVKKLQRDIRTDVAHLRSGEPLFKNYRPKKRSTFSRQRPAGLQKGRVHRQSFASEKERRHTLHQLSEAKKKTKVKFLNPSPNEKRNRSKENEANDSKLAWKHHRNNDINEEATKKYFRLRIVHKHFKSNKNPELKKGTTGASAQSPKKREPVENASYRFSSLPDPSECVSEFYGESKNIYEKTKLKRPWSSPMRMQTKMRHGMLLEDLECGRGIYRPRRLPTKSKLLYRMTVCASAFRKWKMELLVTRDDEGHFARVLQRAARWFLLRLRIQRKRAQKLIAKNYFISRIIRKCKERSKIAGVVRTFTVQATKQGSFTQLIKRFRWAVVLCQRWVRSWIRCKKSRIRALGKLFDNEVKVEFKKARETFDCYVDRMVKSSDVRIAMKDVANIKERWQKCHLRVQKTLIVAHGYSRKFGKRNNVPASFMTMDSDENQENNDVVEVKSKEQMEEGVALRKRLAALQYLRDHYRKGAIRKKVLETIVVKHRKNHLVLLKKDELELKIQNNVHRKVSIHDVQKYISGSLSDTQLRNKRKGFVKHRPLLLLKTAKTNDVPKCVQNAVKFVLKSKALVC